MAAMADNTSRMSIFIPLTTAEDLIRLAGSDGYCSGRVEIYHNGTWGTVCDDGWDVKDAEVVCRQLGCGQLLDIPPPGYFAQGYGPIWIDDVNCRGSETSLLTCWHQGFGTHDCEHYEDAGVICSFGNNGFDMNAANVACRQMGCGPASSIYRYDSSKSYFYEMICSGNESSLTECLNGYSVRLVGPSRCSGWVEIYFSDTWGTVCDNGWDINDAQVVCSQLGCGTALAAPHSAYFGKGMDKIWVDNVASGLIRLVGPNRCSGRVEIYNNGSWGTVCNVSKDLKDARVFCRQLGCGMALGLLHFGEGAGQIWLDDVAYSLIRLAGSNASCSGRVEIYHNDTWGTVCDDGWDLNDAEVACRQLGCGPALGVPRSAYFGQGTGQIWLDNLVCSGNETSLGICRHSGFGTHNCVHGEDAGVICSSGNIKLVGPVLCSGRVEIYNNGTWGTVCNDNWDINDARVVCRQLGCGTAVSVRQFQQGTGQIWLDESGCWRQLFRLSDAERNYDVGDKELLAIKLALEEWRHWLEGACLPVIVWTDHKNLAYLQAAKRLNPRQSRWSLFFSRFNLAISYRPGSKNTKPDALSRQFSADEVELKPVSILPSSWTVGSLRWEIEDFVTRAQREEPDPGTGPQDKIFVPTIARSRVIHWHHSAKFSAHPGLFGTPLSGPFSGLLNSTNVLLTEDVDQLLFTAQGNKSGYPPMTLL
ncbi:scavenger receptor cysteine-rich domain-containing group B protein-like [Girardinichthys multiradiatus]|uniref:scavenger receptor cysteine-rich domain-containing group B protein-like n=1 Tax=Girardinichthys multiradiatus TaxID=208333 RepID=UPI001FAE1172|nr:scavenger receptor cysteine-rich domain-containing group B protein-like [Girardinichthys multiradiatus]